MKYKSKLITLAVAHTGIQMFIYPFWKQHEGIFTWHFFLMSTVFVVTLLMARFMHKDAIKELEENNETRD